MAYSSDDELPDMQLLLEQRIAKSTKEKIILPPSLFDPVTPPESRLKPKKEESTNKTKVESKKAVITETLSDESASRAPKGVKGKRPTAVKKQILKVVTQETAGATDRKTSGGRGGGILTNSKANSLAVESSVLSDYSDHAATENAEKITEPTPQRRRRLVQKKYLVSDDDDDEDNGKEQETVRKLQRAVIDLTFSDSEEEMRLKPRTETHSSDDEGFGSHDSLDVCGAVLTYSPPRSSKPRKVLPPANSSGESTTGRKLSSPKKKAPRIPPSKHRLSSDAFWDQGATNSWIDTNTSYKIPGTVRNLFNAAGDDDDFLEKSSDEEFSDKEQVEEVKRPAASKTKISTSSRSTTSKESKEMSESKKAFNARKKQLAEDFLKTIDDTISNGEVARKTASTGGVKIVWSKTLRTTAGTARWRMEKLQNTSGQVLLGDPLSSDRVKHHATIDLSEKVVDSQEKLYNVLCHEYCHLANYIISNVRKPPHGASFKKWASLCSRAFSSLNVHVTTTHSYEIEAKYKWACQTCQYVYKRHSPSIDLTRHTCGACKGGKLTQTHPPPKEKRPITGYQAFMKENFARIKAENPGTPQREVMKLVADAYRASKSAEGSVKTSFMEMGGKTAGLEDIFGGLKV